MNKISQSALLICALFLAGGVSVAGYFVSQTLYNAKVAVNTAEAKGLAERRVQADRANWSVTFRVAGGAQADIPALYAKAEKNRDAIVAMLREGGFDESEISTGVIDYFYEEFRDDNQNLTDQRHQMVGTIGVETDKVDLVATVRGTIGKLITQGINVENHEPAYRFTKLNEIKPEMLREATMNARIAANEFAENAGVHVGSIRSAEQGSFYIRDAGEEYGDTRKIEKDVRVVTTIMFYLTD